MTTTAIIVLIAFAMGAAFIQRTTGFGFGIFIMTILPYLMPSYGVATTLSGLLAIVTSAAICLRYWHEIKWRKLLAILFIFIIVSFFAVRLVSVLRSDTLRHILGIMLILAAIYFWFFAGKIKIKPTLPTQASLGSISGIMGGLFGMQGPPAVIYFLEVSKTKEEYTAIAQSFFLIGNAVMTIYRAQAGFLTSEVWTAWAWALPGVILGTLIGGWTFKYIPMPLLRKIVYAYIAISGVVALL